MCEFPIIYLFISIFLRNFAHKFNDKISDLQRNE